MAIRVTHMDRRDSADRAQFAIAAFEYCKARKAGGGVTSAKFYWTGADGIAFLEEADSFHAFDDPPKPELAAAMFSLADLGRMTNEERWIDPRTGAESYRIAGR